MTVTKSRPKIEVTVFVEDEAAIEYSNDFEPSERSTDDVVVKCIKAVTDARFDVELKVCKDQFYASIQKKNRQGTLLADTVGNIEVKVFRSGPMDNESSHEDRCSYSSVADLAEKTFKIDVISHSTTCKGPVPQRYLTSWDCPYVDGEDFPIATFTIRYPSADAIQQLHILPRDDIDDLLVEELRRRQR